MFTFLLGQDEWQYMGLGTEEVTAIAINYDNDSIVYAGTLSNFSAGTYGSIYKSIDAGATWDTLLYGLSCADITMHPQNPDIIFASLSIANFTPPGVLKFDSEGNYEFLNNGIYVDWETGVATIEIDPIHPDTMYAGTGGFFGGYLYKTINGGEEWQRIGSSYETENHTDYCGGKLAIAINPENTQELYIACNMNSDIYKSIDGGENWFCSFCDNPDYMFLDLELDKTNPDILYAGLYQWGLLKTVDAGSTWVGINNGLTENRTTSIAINPINTNEILVSTYEYGVFHSVNFGETWNNYNTGLGNLWTIEVKYNVLGNAVYCGTYAGTYKRVIGSLNNTDQDDKPYTFSLKPNFPNPFNGSTIIPFTLNTPGIVKVDIIDINGRYIKKLVDENYNAGEYSVKWDGTDFNNQSMPSGVYFYKLNNNKISHYGKMILMK